MTELQSIIGVIGLISLLAAFSLNVAGILKTNGPFYSIFNSVGSFLLAVYALSLGSFIFTILNVVWGFFGIIKLLFILKDKN